MTATDRFTTTSWTLVYSARDGEGLARLLGRYWSPVYVHLLCKGHQPSDAEDLTQGFLTSKLLERDTLLDRVDRHRGKFRTYLLTCLQNYVRDIHRIEHPTSGPILVPDDPTVIAATKPGPDDSPDEAFDRQWATVTFDTIIRRVEDDCRGAGMERHWRVFETRVLHPQIRGSEPVPAEALIEELGLDHRQQVYDMIETVKRRFNRTAREVIHETVESPDEVEEELATLRRLLAG